MPETPAGVPDVHKFVFGCGADHGPGVGLAADGTGLAAALVLPQADNGAAFVRVHSDDCAGPEDADSPVGAAGNLFVSTTPGIGNCGTLGVSGVGACGVIAVGTGDGGVAASGVGTFNVGETGG